MFKNDNKGIVFKSCRVSPAWYKHGMTIIFTWNDSGYALVIPLNNGRARVYIKPYKPGKL